MITLNARSTRRTLVTAAVAACFCVCLQIRCSRDLNLSHLHVQVPIHAVSPKTAVLARSASGELSRLYPRDEDPRIYSMRDQVVPVRTFVIITPRSTSISLDSITVRAGMSWLPPSTQLLTTQHPETDSETLNVKLPPDVHVACEFTTTPLAAVRLPGISPAINWQGDLWLITVPALQTLVVFLLAYWIKQAFQYVRMMTPACNSQGSPLNFAACCLKLTAVTLIMQQLSLLILDFLHVRDGLQFTLSLALIALAILSGREWLKWISPPPEKHPRFTRAALTIAAIYAVKTIWVMNIETTQIGDYEKYFRYGKAIACDNWNLIQDEHWPTRILYLQRASVYTNLIARLISPDPIALKLVNLLLQLLTTILTAWLTARMFNNTVALITLPLLSLYPAFWYSPTLATPQIPGFFWMTLVWAGVETLRTYLQKLLQRSKLTPALTLQWALITTVIAAATALLQQQKSFAPFVGFAAVSTCTIALLRSEKPTMVSVKNQLRVALLVLITAVITIQTTRHLAAFTQQNILNHLSMTPPVSEIEYLSSIDSSTDGSAQTVSNWRFAMLPAVPHNTRMQLNARKLLHEKAGVGLELFACAFRKSASLVTSETQDHLNRTFGGNRNCTEGISEYTRVPWRTLQLRLSQAMLAALLSLTLIRVLTISKQPLATAELFPLSFVLINYLGILFFFEAGPYYAQILAFPLVWSAAIVISGTQIPQPNSPKPASNWNLPTRTMIYMFAVLVLFTLTSRLVDSSGWTFLRFAPPDDAKTNTAMPAIHASRVHQALLMTPHEHIIKAGDVATADITILQPFRHSDTLAFFLTGDARARNLYYTNQHWDTIPLRYSIRSKNQLLATGTLGELQPATFQQITRQQVSNNAAAAPSTLTLTVTLNATKDINVRQLGFTPAIAVEYPFNPISQTPKHTSPTARPENP